MPGHVIKTTQCETAMSSWTNARNAKARAILTLFDLVQHSIVGFRKSPIYKKRRMSLYVMLYMALKAFLFLSVRARM